MIRSIAYSSRMFVVVGLTLGLLASVVSAASPFDIHQIKRALELGALQEIRKVKIKPVGKVSGVLLKVHAYKDGSWPGEGGVWIPGATVTAKNTQTGVVSTLVTDKNSDASFYLPPGTYEIHVKKDGVGQGTQTHVLPAQGLLVSFPISKSRISFPGKLPGKIFLPGFPVPKGPVVK